MRGMKTALPWQIKGVRRQARETARTAARRAGMSVGEWLDTIILNSAEPNREVRERDAAGSDEHDLHRDDEHDEEEPPQRSSRIWALRAQQIPVYRRRT